MSGAPAAATASGYERLHAISVTLAAQAGKALANCRRLATLYPELDEIVLATDDARCAAFAQAGDAGKVRVVDENLLYPKAEWLEVFARFAHLSPGRGLWYYQQMLKLAFLLRTAARLAQDGAASRTGLLIWDSDTLALRPIPLFDPQRGISYCYFTDNPRMLHPPFLAVNALLTGTRREDQQACSNIVQFAALSAGEILQFARYLGIDSGEIAIRQLAQRVADAILRADLRNSALFSEYELLGLFQKLQLGAPARRAKFVRVNKKRPSRAQERFMGALGMDHFTSEEWYGEATALGNARMLWLVAEQCWPPVGRARHIVQNWLR